MALRVRTIAFLQLVYKGHKCIGKYQHYSKTAQYKHAVPQVLLPEIVKWQQAVKVYIKKAQYKYVTNKVA
jgi:hypothetical protein